MEEYEIKTLVPFMLERWAFSNLLDEICRALIA